MGGKYFLASIFCALALASCDFEQEYGEETVKDFSEASLDVNISADDQCTLAIGGLSNDSYLKTNLTAGGDLYVYYSGSGDFTGTESKGYSASLPSVQSGRLEDLKDAVLYYSWVRNDALQKTEVDGSVTTVSADVKMHPAFALVKLNIPEELKAKNVSLKASVPVTGGIQVQPQKGWGTWGESSMMSRIDDDPQQSEVITISSQEEYVSGDLYVALLPDAFDEFSNAYGCSVGTLTFDCVYYEGELSRRYAFDESLLCGTVTDLGQIPMPKPKVPVEGGKIRLMPDATLTIGITDANPDCEYYYEIASSKESCKEPTVNSTKFDPVVGFAPEITGYFDRYYIKILAHPLDTDYKGVVLEASLRNWHFQDGCPVDEIISEIAAGNKLNKAGEKEITAHGLEIYRNQDNALTDYEAPANRIAFTTARVQINAITEYASDAWIGFFVDKNISVKEGNTRGYRFYYNNSQSTTGYWKESLTSAGTTADRYNLCLHLTEIFKDNGIKAGDKFGLRGDGKHVYYGIALLEVL